MDNILRNRNKILWVLTVLVLAFIVGFFVGRKTTAPTTEMEYVKGDVARDTVLVPEPVFVNVPIRPILPIKLDSFNTAKVDTSAIIADYIKKKDYRIRLFDDNERGKLTVFPSLQQNELTSVSYEYTPVMTLKGVDKERMFIPYLGVSYNTLNYTGMTVGVFYNAFSFEYSYHYNSTLNSQYHQFGLNIKF